MALGKRDDDRLMLPTPASRLDRWVLDHRGPKAALDERQAYAAIREDECDAAGALAATAVVFLTNKECPFRCLMCDLWVNTLDETVSRGAVPHQIRRALASLPPVRQVKLYNAGSFFDPDAIPVEDDADIAQIVGDLDRVIVESHPAFLRGRHGERCLRVRDAIGGQLEVAIGLETAHPGVLARLNKRMTVASFARAADFLIRHDIAVRVFILLKPPFMSEEDGVVWACRSIDTAIECGASVCSIIPTRPGNGALEAAGEPFVPPSLTSLERVVEYGLSRKACRVFADVWDAGRFFNCACSPRRAERLRLINREQRLVDPVRCGVCETV